LLRDAGVTEVLATSPAAEHTVRPLADLLELEVVLSVADTDALAHAIVRSSGRTVVGTDRVTVQELVAELGGDPGSPVDDDEFDRIYVLIPTEQGVRTLLHRFGQPYQD
jgi:hypothetical protein